MSTNFFFKSLKVDNYRGLKNLNIESLRRVNLIGGLNGTGKSTLLDAIFLFLDRRSPVALMRPFISRNLQASFPNGLDYIFGSLGIDNSATISASTIQGEYNLSLSRGKPPSLAMNIAIGNNPLQQNQIHPTTIDPDQIGIHLTSTFNKKDDGAVWIVQTAQDAINFNMYRASISPVVAGAYVSSTSRISPLEDAQRFSVLFKEKRLQEIVTALAFVNSDLESFQLLQEGNQPTLYAVMKNGNLLQTSMLGGGFQSFLSIVLLLMATKDGVVLFDEVDAAIHYSKLSLFWSTIEKLAEQQNCQVFAVTHSRECIEYALKGFTDMNKLADLQYLRLENDDNETDCISYSGEELADAISDNWEIR